MIFVSIQTTEKSRILFAISSILYLRKIAHWEERAIYGHKKYLEKLNLLMFEKSKLLLELDHFHKV
jgi:hypothetical protein